jgi:Domain of unknown function (DUF4276)
MTLFVAPIVEGQTEQGCVERLLWRVWTDVCRTNERLQVLTPIRRHRDVLVDEKREDLTKAVEEAQLTLRARTRRDPQGRPLVLILLDAEQNCPGELGPQLLARGQQAWQGADVACVIAKRMIENWIVAGATPATLGGVNGLPADVQAPTDPEDRNGARWLNDQIRKQSRSGKYAKTVDGPAFVERMDLQLCRGTAPSFDKLCRVLEVRAQAGGQPAQPAPPG